MNLEQQIFQKVRQLSVEKQQELLNFAEFLQNKAISQPKFNSIKGLCSDLRVDLENEEIEQARKEVWTKFTEDI